MTTREQYEDWFRGYYKQEPMPELGAPAHDFCWAGYIAGAASRDAEIESLRQQLDAALEACKAKDDIILEVLECESTTRPPIRLREALAIQPDDSALKDKAMTTYEQPKDWIERHFVEDPGGLLACEPSRLDTLNEELRLARQANEAQHQPSAKSCTILYLSLCISFTPYHV